MESRPGRPSGFEMPSRSKDRASGRRAASLFTNFCLCSRHLPDRRRRDFLLGILKNGCLSSWRPRAFPRGAGQRLPGHRKNLPAGAGPTGPAKGRPSHRLHTGQRRQPIPEPDVDSNRQYEPTVPEPESRSVRVPTVPPARISFHNLRACSYTEHYSILQMVADWTGLGSPVVRKNSIRMDSRGLMNRVLRDVGSLTSFLRNKLTA
jgi:hypothetical protein